MKKKNHKNWEKIQRIYGYKPSKYPLNFRRPNPSKKLWILDFICFIIFFVAFILLLWLYITEHGVLLIIPLFLLGGFIIIYSLYLWRSKFVFQKSTKKPKSYNNRMSNEKKGG